MTSIIQSIVGRCTWDACAGCINASEDGDPCERDSFNVEGDFVFCGCYRTEEQERERHEELSGDVRRESDGDDDGD